MQEKITKWIEEMNLPYTASPEQKNLISINLKPKMLILIEKKYVRISLILGSIENFDKDKMPAFFEGLLILSGQMNLMKASLHGNTLTFDTDLDTELLDFNEFREGITNTVSGFEEFRKLLVDLIGNNENLSQKAETNKASEDNATTPQPETCECGAKIIKGSKFCNMCGKQL